jgi:oxalate decarboxylase
MSLSRRNIVTAAALGASGAVVAQAGLAPALGQDAAPPVVAKAATEAAPKDFSIDLLAQNKSVEADGCWLKEANFRNFPVSTAISGGVISLAPGALRELHWHAQAAEWAYVIAGRCRVTIIDPLGRFQTVDFAPGDIWYFPRGFGHSIQCVGEADCIFLLAFDSGTYSEYGTFSLTDWVATIPRHILSSTFGVPPHSSMAFRKKAHFFQELRLPLRFPSNPYLDR